MIKFWPNAQSTFAGKEKKEKRFRRKGNTKKLTRIDAIREKTEIFEVLMQVNNKLWKMKLGIVVITDRT